MDYETDEIDREEESDTEIDEIDPIEGELDYPRQEEYLEDILFIIPNVICPLTGTPKEVQLELDDLVYEMQKDLDSQFSSDQYEKIVLYMHSYLINVVLKQFPYIKGMEHADTYQESLIALRFKAIPNFKKGKGMSFLNFSKMCIRRHLITILHASKNRQRDQSINRAISIDTPISMNEDSTSNTFASIIPNNDMPIDEATEQNEAIYITKKRLMDALSDFENMVLEEYLTYSSYRGIAQDIAERLGEDYTTMEPLLKIKHNKAVDNALWRIRKKAAKIRNEVNTEYLPIFLKRK